MNATITIHDILATYTKFAAGKLNYTNRKDKFFSEFICHVIGEMLVVPGMQVHGLNYSLPATFGDMVGIDDQFKTQWCEKVIGITDRKWGVIERWNEGTEYSPSALGMADFDHAKYEQRTAYRLACLTKAAIQFPDLTFTFTNFLPTN